MLKAVVDMKNKFEKRESNLKLQQQSDSSNNTTNRHTSFNGSVSSLGSDCLLYTSPSPRDCS